MRQKLISVVLIAALSWFLALYFTYPLIEKLDTSFFPMHDQAYNAWVMWYTHSNRENIIINPKEFFSPKHTVPFPGMLSLSDPLIIPSVFIYGSFRSLGWAHVPSVNLTTLVGFGLTFFFSTIALWYLLKRLDVSIIGSTIFTYSHVMLTHYKYGHLEYVFRFMVPLVVASYVWWKKNPNKKRALVLCFLYFLSWMTNIQISVFLTLLLLFFVLFDGYRAYISSRLMQWLASFREVVLYGLIFGVVLGWIYHPYLYFSQRENWSRGLFSSYIYSARPKNYLLGEVNSLVLSDYFGSDFLRPVGPNGETNYSERTLFMGVVSGLLVLTSFYYIRDKSFRKRVGWLMAYLISVVISFGPFLYLDSKNSFLRLPYYYLYKVFPLLGATRTPARIILVSMFWLVVYVGMFLSDRIKKTKKGVGVVLVLFGLLLIDYRVAWSEDFGGIPYPAKTPDIIDGKRIIFYPYFIEDDDYKEMWYMNAVVDRNIEMINGHVGSTVKGQEELDNKLKGEKFSNNWYSRLMALGIDYIVIAKQLEDIAPFNLSEYDILDFAVVFDDEDWRVVDVNQFDQDYCIGDVKNLFFYSEYHEDNKYVFAENSSDCFVVVSSREDRYYKYSDSDGSYWVQVPPIIDPGEHAWIDMFE